MAPPLDLSGQVFGRWTVLRRAGLTRHKKAIWECRCACGAVAPVTSGNLVQGLSRQCRQCADTCADHDGPRAARPKPPKRCDGCGREFVPKRSTARWCSPGCKARSRWADTSAQERAAHCARVCADSKRRRAVYHPACAWCSRPFSGAPSRLHCSRKCLDAAIASGKYRTLFLARRAAREAAEISAELERRLQHGQAPAEL